MMSSEEESDSHGSFGDKLSKKQKRARQRVDAGEPRNSYSSIPNFTSRPGFMSGGIYGAIFPQGRQQFGFFGPGYAPAKMLNELLARPPKQEADEEGARADLSHDALRDFLQGHKKELQQLERELRHASPDNNNSLANNNNDEPKERRDDADADGRERLAEREREREPADELDADSRSLPSPPSVERLVTPKLEPDAEADRERASLTPRPDKMPLEVKRARVENIVSTMRSSPVPPALPQVNGCKKRKLYHPQQHGTEAERYLARAHSLSIDSSEEDSERPPIQQKLVEKNALKSQLRSMQEQLAEMQQKYVQLCNRMEHESETVDNDDAASSDVEQLDEVMKPSPASSPKKIDSPPPVSGAPNVLSQVMSKMMSANRHAPHPPTLQPGFNGSIPMMPHLAPGPEPHPLHHAPPHPHHNINSAAAMYLNVSQKLFMEQEAMRAKDHAEQQNFAAQQQHHQQQRTQSNQHSPNARPPMGPTPKPPTISSELVERLDALRNNANSVGPVSGADLERLAEVLKSEITASLTSLVDSIVTRFVHERRFAGKQSEAAAAAAERLNKDLMLASRLLGAERKSPGTKERAGGPPGHIAGMFQPPKPPPGLNPALYGAMNGQSFCVEREPNPEQNEALSLVVTPKKKRHKVTDTRITPRTVSRILGEGMGPSPAPASAPESPSPRPYPPGMSLPTSVAIPNPSLHESQVFSPYSPFFGAGGMGAMGGMGGMMRAAVGHSPPAPLERDSPPLPHAPALLHPALLAAAHRASTTPDYLRHHHLDQQDPHSDCNSTDIPYDGIQPTSSTLTPMHLRKAKLMFFWVRYPSSAVLKMYFPDIKFNKNNTAQLVKWFSNFREFYYIQMEKYARQAISEGQKSADELHVAGDSEIYRVLNLHYNRNNHIEVPSNFRYVVEQTLREFFRAIQGGKDTEQSWKKSIYKIISRLDDPVPEYFKSPNFLEQLE